MIFTLSSFTKFDVKDENGRKHTIQLDDGGLIFMTLLKIAGMALFLKMGLEALKTFKPIVKDIHKQELASIFNPQ